jgi:glycosyltransferase involved in cell wall biosynthesis
MSQPLVSIIIPSYNSKAYLKEAVASALNQSYDPIEIIVVNDGSTDDTQDLFPEFESKGVTCHTIQNGGASNARNFGMSKAQGDYIQFLDADDILVDSKIEKQLQLMQLQNADISYTPWIDIVENPNDTFQKQFKFLHIDHTLIRTGQELMTSFGMDNWFIPTLAWLVKKELLNKAGFWNPVKCPNDDGEYFSRVLFWAERVVCCDENLAYYRVTLYDSLSKLNSHPKIQASFNSYQQIEALLLTCNDRKLMSYTKRLYYMQYKLIKKKYPKLAKRAAHHFDKIEAPSFLMERRRYWMFINWFGLYRGTKLYKRLQPLWVLFKGQKSASKIL